MFVRLKELRRERKMTQKQISEVLNMSQTGYNQYEIGRNDIPTRVLIKLAEFYGTSADYILNITDDKNPYPKSTKKIEK